MLVSLQKGLSQQKIYRLGLGELHSKNDNIEGSKSFILEASGSVDFLDVCISCIWLVLKAHIF